MLMVPPGRGLWGQYQKERSYSTSKVLHPLDFQQDGYRRTKPTAFHVCRYWLISFAALALKEGNAEEKSFAIVFETMDPDLKSHAA